MGEPRAPSQPKPAVPVPSVAKPAGMAAAQHAAAHQPPVSGPDKATAAMPPGHEPSVDSPGRSAAARGLDAPVQPPPFGQMLPESPPVAGQHAHASAAGSNAQRRQEHTEGKGQCEGLFDSSDSDAAEEVPLGPAAGPAYSARQADADAESPHAPAAQQWAASGAAPEQRGPQKQEGSAAEQRDSGAAQQRAPSNARPAHEGVPDREAVTPDQPHGGTATAGRGGRAGVGAGTPEDPVMLSSSSSDDGSQPAHPPPQACPLRAMQLPVMSQVLHRCWL